MIEFIELIHQFSVQIGKFAAFFQLTMGRLSGPWRIGCKEHDKIK
jgi:hypothetical protein